MKQTWLMDFEEYLSSRRGIKESTRQNYLRYIRRFLDIADSVGSHIDARHLFEVSNIKTYYNIKSGSIASAVLTAFAEYLLENKEINKHEMLIIKDRLLEMKKPAGKQNEIKVLSKKEIEFILSGRVYYRFVDNPNRLDKEISYVGPAIWTLALAGLEQQELINLKTEDLEVSHNCYRIRNPYKGTDDTLTEWIILDDIAKSKIIRYLEYRDTLNVESDRLLLIKKQPLNNSSINYAFSIFKRAENCDRFENGGEIHAQLLVRSSLTQALYQTNGTCLINIVQILGMKHSQVFYAVREYLSKK